MNTPLDKKIHHKLGSDLTVYSDISSSPMLSNKFLHKTIHSAGHDLRSPLFVIRSYGYLLQKTQDKDKLKRGFQLIEEASYKMEKTINEFVGLMDIYTLPFPEKKMVSFLSAFEGASYNLAELIEEFHPNISIDFEAFPEVSFNEEHLTNIMTYLIDNAIRHNLYNDDLHITISSKKINDNIILEVFDNGKGVEEGKEQEKITEPFYSNTSLPDCFGIGLAKVQAIAQVSKSSFHFISKANEFAQCSFVFNT